MDQNLETRINAWAQVATTVAVIVGLGLVIWELQQTRELTRAQLANDLIGDITQRQIALYGEDARIVVAKACFDSTSLTREDMVILNAYFTNEMTSVSRYLMNVQLGNLDIPVRSRIAPHLRRILGFPGGKAWLRNTPFWDSVSIVQSVVDEIIIETTDDDARAQEWSCATILEPPQ